MTNEEVLQLVNAGFTADEIRAFGWSPEPKNEEPKDNGGNAGDPDDKLGDPEAGSRELPKALLEQMDAMSKSIDNLNNTVKALQENNQKNARKTKNDNAPKSADEVIKGFIENM